MRKYAVRGCYDVFKRLLKRSMSYRPTLNRHTAVHLYVINNNKIKTPDLFQKQVGCFISLNDTKKPVYH